MAEYDSFTAWSAHMLDQFTHVMPMTKMIISSQLGWHMHLKLGCFYGMMSKQCRFHGAASYIIIYMSLHNFNIEHYFFLSNTEAALNGHHGMAATAQNLDERISA